MTQDELAARIRVRRHRTTGSYVCRIERGSIDPRVSTVVAIARVLEVQSWMLLADLRDNPRFWNEYLALSPAQKREVQRVIHYRAERRGL